MQYRVILGTDGQTSPVFNEATLQYVVNEKPEFQNVTASQGDDGIVNVSYGVRDIDTNTDTKQAAGAGHLTTSLQYCESSCGTESNWHDAIAATGAGIGVVDTNTTENPANQNRTDTYAPYSVTWNAKAELGEKAKTGTFQIRMKADDGEAGNRYGYSSGVTIADFDTQNPTNVTFKIDHLDTENKFIFNNSLDDDSDLSYYIWADGITENANITTESPIKKAAPDSNSTYSSLTEKTITINDLQHILLRKNIHILRIFEEINNIFVNGFPVGLLNHIA